MAVLSPITKIAIIDDDFAQITAAGVPGLEGNTLTKLLSTLDQESQADLTDRGLEKDQFSSCPNEVFEALTDPTRPLGAAFAYFSLESGHLGRMIEARRNVRLLSRDIRTVSNAEVAELAPQRGPGRPFAVSTDISRLLSRARQRGYGTSGAHRTTHRRVTQLRRKSTVDPDVLFGERTSCSAPVSFPTPVSRELPFCSLPSRNSTGHGRYKPTSTCLSKLGPIPNLWPATSGQSRTA